MCGKLEYSTCILNLLSFSCDCVSCDFLSLSFIQIFDKLYLTQFLMKTLDNLYVDLYTYTVQVLGHAYGTGCLHTCSPAFTTGLELVGGFALKPLA